MTGVATPSARPACRRCGVEISPEDSYSGFCFGCLLLPALDFDEPNESSESASRFDHYEVRTHADGSLIELGRGSMGVTYEAVDTRLQFRVALKVINPRGSAEKGALIPAEGPDAVLRERFLREARAAAQLRHPHVANVLYYGVTGDGRCFYAMELVEGQNVAQRVRSGGPLPVADALEIIAQTASALEAGEKFGLVHRDLKPANLMLADGPGINVKVIDFGLAKMIGGQDEEKDITHDGFVGTPAFASPEQFLGSPLDHRSDYFSLGSTLFYLLTLDIPFKPGQTSGTGGKVNAGFSVLDKLKTAAIPLPVIELISSLLAGDPADRPQTGKALNEAIRECQRKLTSYSPIAIPPTQGSSDGVQSSGGKAEIQPAGAGDARRRNARVSLPASLEETQSLHPPYLLLKRFRSFLFTKLGIVTGAAGVIVLSGVVFLCYREISRVKPDSTLQDKTIAVLPFENISANKDKAYFADGIHDELLNNLARISQLKVISRTSVMRYAGDSKRNLREIATALGAGSIVEGTVLREANQVRINVELIDARNDQMIWADSYDRNLVSIFEIESEIAQTVAAKLTARLSPAEQRLISQKPTQNPAAYDLYLKGKQLIADDELASSDLGKRMTQAIALFEQAVQIDPQFALAYSSIAHAQDCLFYATDHTPDRLALADQAIKTALRLAPGLPEVQLSYAYHLYYGYQDYQAAKIHLDMARAAGMPTVYGLELQAILERGQGRFEAAAQELRTCVELDPLNPKLILDLAMTLFANRQFRESAEAFDRLIALAPDNLSYRIQKCLYVTFMETGDMAPYEQAIAKLPASEAGDPGTVNMKLSLALYQRNWEKAKALVNDLAAVSAEDDADFGYGVTPVPVGCYSLLLARLQHVPITSSFVEARDFLAKKSAEMPSDAPLLSTLALVEALLGDRDAQAIADGERAAEMLPISKDALRGPDVLSNLAVVYAWCGKLDQAFNELSVLVKAPYGIYYGHLKVDPLWDPLRKDPRFDQLLAQVAPRQR